MATGPVDWYGTEKNFGFVTQDDGGCRWRFGTSEGPVDPDEHSKWQYGLGE
jgi:hypothetical protein